MKKTALIISMVAFLSLQGFSQWDALSYGFKLGPTFDWASSASTASSNEGMRLGFGFGGVVDYYFTNIIAASTGVNVNFWRGHYEITDYRAIPYFLQNAKVDVDRRVRSTYIEIPLKAKVKTKIVDDWKAFVEAGAAIGINAATKTKDKYSFQWVEHTDSYFTDDYYDQYRTLQFALNFGVGAEYQINSKFGLFAQISVSHALSNTFTHNFAKQTANDLKTNYVGIEVGIVH